MTSTAELPFSATPAVAALAMARVATIPWNWFRHAAGAADADPALIRALSSQLIARLNPGER